MITLSLDSEHAQVLREALERAVSDLNVEISSTDLKDYRDHLKVRRATLQQIVAQLLETAA